MSFIPQVDPKTFNSAVDDVMNSFKTNGHTDSDTQLKKEEQTLKDDFISYQNDHTNQTKKDLLTEAYDAFEKHATNEKYRGQNVATDATKKALAVVDADVADAGKAAPAQKPASPPAADVAMTNMLHDMGGKVAANPSAAISGDVQHFNQDISAGNSAAVLKDLLQLCVDASAAGGGFKDLATEAGNGIHDILNKHFDGKHEQSLITQDYSRAHESISKGPLSLKSGWGIDGGSGNAANMKSSLAKVLGDLNSGSVGDLFQNAAQLALDAYAAGKTDLANKAQNLARAIASGGSGFDYAGSYKTLADAQAKL
jgi:hypothetical protein